MSCDLPVKFTCNSSEIHMGSDQGATDSKKVRSAPPVDVVLSQVDTKYHSPDWHLAIVSHVGGREPPADVA